MPRRLKSAVELVSDIGAKAFDLQQHSELEIAKAVAFLREVNGPMFDWLIQRLADPHPHLADMADALREKAATERAWRENPPHGPVDERFMRHHYGAKK